MSDWTPGIQHNGAKYDGYMGRWSLRMAPEFLHWLAAPVATRWLDVGCGTGALTRTILDQCAPEYIVGMDPLETFVEYASRQRTHDRVDYCVADAGAIPASAHTFDQVVSGLALNFMPDPDLALAEMKRVTAPRGRVALYIWDYAQGMEMLRYFFDAVIVTDPDSIHEDEGKRFPICQPDALRDAFGRAGFSDVVVDPIQIDAHFVDFDDYWNPFLAGLRAPGPRYVASRTEAQRELLRAHLLQHLPLRADGSFVLTLRAWAAQGSS